MGGVKVVGDSSKLKNLIKKYKIDELIIAIPSAEGEVVSKFVKLATELKTPFKIVPRVREIIEGKASLSSVRKVEIEDLLGRPVVKEGVSRLKRFFKGKSVLVTGAAGSIGSELALQVAAYKPKKLILFDVWENGIFALKQKFKDQNYLEGIYYVIGNIQDTQRLQETFDKFKPNFVFHAAAYKHVPLMEENSIEALKNNILGTYNLSSLSFRNQIEKFVMISTDKAANPKNIMGLTKLFAESIVRSFSGKTRYLVVRFGNVLGSNGSVIPTFKRQIENGGPVTVTHKNMTRYFMTIPEACGLILKSAEIGTGGELFVLNMGKPVSILDLAKKMIRLSGFIPDVNIKIIFTGIRKGEKLNERLFTKTEKLNTTNDDKIFISKKNTYFVDLDETIKLVYKLLKNYREKDIKKEIRKIMRTNLAKYEK